MESEFITEPEVAVGPAGSKFFLFAALLMGKLTITHT